MAPRFKAVIFDMGGVFLKYPDPGVFDRLNLLGKTKPELLETVEKFELGEISAVELRETIQNIDDGEYRERHIKNAQVLDSKNHVIDQNFVTAALILRKHGIKVALLTNNGWMDHDKTKSLILEDLSMFDLVVESCRVQMRKPLPEIYLHTAELLHLDPEECVFVDDLEKNIEGAKRVGMEGVRVLHDQSEAAIKQLEAFVGIDLS